MFSNPVQYILSAYSKETAQNIHLQNFLQVKFIVFKSNSRNKTLPYLRSQSEINTFPGLFLSVCFNGIQGQDFVNRKDVDVFSAGSHREKLFPELMLSTPNPRPPAEADFMNC